MLNIWGGGNSEAVSKSRNKEISDRQIFFFTATKTSFSLPLSQGLIFSEHLSVEANVTCKNKTWKQVFKQGNLITKKKFVNMVKSISKTEKKWREINIPRS